MTGPLGIPFTDASAWEFIATLSEKGHAIERIMLEKPHGEIGYVLTVKIQAEMPGVDISAMPDLYIKIQLKGNKIFGRSFHYSTA